MDEMAAIVGVGKYALLLKIPMDLCWLIVYKEFECEIVVVARLDGFDRRDACHCLSCCFRHVLYANFVFVDVHVLMCR